MNKSCNHTPGPETEADNGELTKGKARLFANSPAQ